MHFHSADSRNGRLAAELSHSHLTFALQIWFEGSFSLGDAQAQAHTYPLRCLACLLVFSLARIVLRASVVVSHVCR